MGNCCLPFVGHDDSQENAMESLPLHSESHHRITTSLPTYTSFPKYTPSRNKEKQRRKAQYAFRGYQAGFRRIPNDGEAELIAAGWPSWMVEDAGEALKGWVPREEKSFRRLEKIGEGTYSHVYRALDLEQQKIVALKKITVNDLEPETIRFMAREIRILRQLDHPNIIKLEGVVASAMSYNFYLVLEYMEHDLAGLASHPGVKFTEAQVKCYMKQVFCGLDYCHRQGILHRDIKGSNLLLDNNGNLKIADFGLANFYNPQKVRPLTNRVVTLWYRPPELLLGATCYNSGVDLWSAGCVLAEVYAGEPIFPGRTEVDQLHRIFMLCGSPSEDYWRKLKLHPADIFDPQKPFKRRVAEIFKGIPAPALALIETLLSIDPSARQSAIDALNSEFFCQNRFQVNLTSCPSILQAKSSMPKFEQQEDKRLEEARVTYMMSKGKGQLNLEPFQHFVSTQNCTSQCWQVFFINNKSFVPGSYRILYLHLIVFWHPYSLSGSIICMPKQRLEDNS